VIQPVWQDRPAFVANAATSESSAYQPVFNSLHTAASPAPSVVEKVRWQEEQEAEPVRANGTDGGKVVAFHPLAHTANGHSGSQTQNGQSSQQVEAPSQQHPRQEASVIKAQEKVAEKKSKAASSKSAGPKPPRVGVNIEWVQKGVGWDCREVYYVGSQRRRRRLGHIGKQKWEEMLQYYEPAELEETLRQWIEARRTEKSIGMLNEQAGE
jgi:hypothetical protein